MNTASSTNILAMPKRVLIIGLLFAIVGANSIWNTIETGLHDGLHISFSIFMLPVGIGLLRGKRSSQWWASAWIILGYGSAIVIALFAVCAPNEKISWFGFSNPGSGATPHVLAFSIIYAVCLRICRRYLYSIRANAYLPE